MMGDQIVDEFYAARNQLYLGGFQQAAAALDAMERGASGAEAEAERRALRWRALVGQGRAQEVADAIPAAAAGAEAAVRQLALLRAGRGVDEAAVAGLADDEGAGAAAAAATAQLLLALGRAGDALRVAGRHARSVECAATAVAAYVQLGRADLALKAVAAARAWAEDAPIAQLAEAWAALAAGGDARCAEAAYAFDELAQAAAPPPPAPLLNAQAVSRMHRGLFAEAAELLQEAAVAAPAAPDVLANLAVCASHMAAPHDARARYVAQLRRAAPGHPFLADLDAKAAEFDAAAARIAAGAGGGR